MNRVTRGTVVLAAALAALSCKGDPTDSLRNGVDKLVANPSAVFLRPDTTKGIIVEALDEQGNRLATDFKIKVNPAAGVALVEDTAYNIVFDVDGNAKRPSPWTRARYEVTATGSQGDYSFTISAGGKDLVIPVRILPDTASSITLSNAAPALGDTVIATAGVGFKFTPASTASISGASVVTLGISADSTQLSFLPGPSANNPVVVTNMVVAYSTGIGGYSANSAATNLTTPAVTNFVATYSSSTPALNDTTTISAAGFKFLPNAAITVGGRPATIVARASDSSSINFVAVPGTNGAISVSNMVLSFLTAVPLTLPATVGITAPAGLGGTNAFATAPTIPVPGAGQSVTFLDAGSYAAVAECTGDLGGPCRVYKIVVAANRTIGLTITWQGTTDLGVYTYDNTQSLDTGLIVCDSKGAGAGGQPETCSAAFTPGTYYLVVDSFSPFYGAPNNVDPTDIKMVLTGS